MSSSSQICFVSVTFYIISLLAERAGGGVIFVMLGPPPRQQLYYVLLFKSSNTIAFEKLHLRFLELNISKKSLILQHCERSEQLQSYLNL